MGNVNGELTSSSTLRTVSGNGISVSEGKMKLAEEMELEEMPAVWPPVIENVYTPLNIPFGNPVKLQDPNGNSDRVFYDEMGHSILSEESLLMVQLPTRLPFSDKTYAIFIYIFRPFDFMIFFFVVVSISVKVHLVAVLERYENLFFAS